VTIRFPSATARAGRALRGRPFVASYGVSAWRGEVAWCRVDRQVEANVGPADLGHLHLHGVTGGGPPAVWACRTSRRLPCCWGPPGTPLSASAGVYLLRERLGYLGLDSVLN